MASHNLNDLVRFCDDVEQLCKIVAEGIDGNAEHQSLKEHLLIMADAAADFGTGLQPTLHSKDPKHAVINLEHLAEALL